MFFIKILAFLSYFLLIFNIILFFKEYMRQNKVYKIFCYYLLFTLIIQLISEIYIFLDKENLFLTHYYFTIQFFFLSFFYKELIKWRKQISVVLFITFLFLIIQYLVKPNLYFEFNLLEILFCSIPLLIYSFQFFFENIDGKNKKFIYVNSAIFTYILSSTLIFSSGNIMPNLPKSINSIIWTVNAFLYLIFQVLIFIEWYKNFRIPKLLKKN